MTTSLPLVPQYFKGHKRAPNKNHLIELSHHRNAFRLRALKAEPLPSSWDSRTKGWIGPVKDQAQCGSCWDFSGTCVVEVAFYKAGILKPDGSQALSEEYTLSCGRNGGCDGDDNTTVLADAKSHGLPLSSVYGPYDAGNGNPGRCKFVAGSMELYKIDDWLFANSSGDTGQTVTPTPDIKAAIMAYGCVGCAVAAGGDSFWDTGKGTGVGRSNQIDHDVVLVGWDDDHDNGDGSKGAWVMRNSWGTGWGDGGYAWIKYGAYSIGTESVAAVKKNPNPPAPPLPPWWI